MKAYHIIAEENGWKIVGTSIALFKTQEQAVSAAIEIAKAEEATVIVHSRDGRVISVNNSFQKDSSKKILPAKVKRTLKSKNVRNAIAEVMYANSYLR